MAAGKTKLAIIYYSTYGHVAELAQKVKEGASKVAGVEVSVFQVKETLPEDVRGKMHIPPQPEDIPFVDVKTLDQYDAFIFGFPTRYGNVAAQFKTFWDSTGQLWQKGALVGKPFGLFTSTASIGGGQEVTLYSALPNFIHHGMIYVPIGYAFGAELYRLDEVRGGTPWGAGTFSSGDGSRKPSKFELDQAEFQGKFCAEKFAKFNGSG